MSSGVPAARGEQAGPRQWLGLVILALPTLLIAMDNTVLFLAVPHISAALDAGGTEMLWIQDSYLFFVAGFLITMGTLADRMGRKRLLLIGAGVFGGVSILAAYSVSPSMLIATRALLGVAAATIAPTTLALLRTMFADQKQRTRAISVLMACFMSGGAVGPLVGGALLERFWWGSVFLIAVPVMLLTFAFGPALLPEDRDPRPGRLDLTSVALSLAAVLPVIYGIKTIARNTAIDAGSAAAMVAGAVAAGLFVVRQHTLTAPLLDLRLFRRRAFSAALGALLAGQLLMGGTLFLLSQYLQLVLDKSPASAGLWLLPATAVMALAALVLPALAERFRRERVIAFGLLVAAAGFALLSQLGTGGGPALLVAGLVLGFGGVAPLLLLTVDLVIASAPPHKAGAAGAMSETSSEFGLALGIATLGSAAAIVYRHRVRRDLPDDVPARVADAAEESLVGAAGAGPRLPGRLAAEVVDTARNAFTSGLNTVGLIGAALLVCTSIAIATLLRTRRT